ncbi:alpha/beta hydrolase [Halalkalibacillus sediminis]|uniref:Alpha/beta hydrolase n=1 Tax=Halalkalibacillus sediminis TaxID=2018042 RepID=A0A2I0QRD7_9BACI|nr:alpha/beta hydrolase [Halalkalibacillus sediminis]PKR76896.1 alpha/beta hydrolase [Halalkalibacillus sediminis]
MSTIELKKVKVPNGETIAYRERSGGDQTVLLIHGNMISSKHWDIFMEAFDSSYHLVAIDLPGFGESTYLSEINSIQDLSNHVRLFVEALDLDLYAIVGWSTGGAVGLQYCANYDHPTEKLVLLASASTRGYPFYATGEDGLPDPTRRLETFEEVKQDPGKTLAIQGAYDRKDRDLLKAIWNQLIYTHNQPSPDKYEEYVDDLLTQRNLAEIYHALNTFNISNEFNGLIKGTGEVDKIDVPTLVLRGERDFVITEDMAKEIVEDLGDLATFVELKDSGHSPLVDDMGQLVREIEEFLKK